MMEQTSFGKDRTVSNYLPFITGEMAKSLAEKGIGVGEFLTRNPVLQEPGEEEGLAEITRNSADSFPGVSGPDVAGREGKERLKMPVPGRISSGYGLRHDPLDGKLKQHNGMDIALPEGTPVTPAAPGKVVFSGYSGGYGNCVIIEHGDGMTSLYAHNSENLVKAGEVVDTNTIIALSGATGRSTGPHLHFEVRKEGVPVNPLGLIG
ncbi:MAG: M23 family metallopeptidase [Alphaproteobacteria bacterium]|uniref:M23 family metallopeptidase n=1 Tax=Candidatus Nitrobium versatile TaxID=2884831 RepID=A0A953J414_9BACT|nr:M23 family metallopeptidase [Candidatus Nitrobium versatile]